MTSTEIKVILLERGITQTALANRFGCHKSMISHLIARRVKSKNLEDAIARILKTTREKLWEEG
jgi:transcriptional regulator